MKVEESVSQVNNWDFCFIYYFPITDSNIEFIQLYLETKTMQPVLCHVLLLSDSQSSREGQNVSKGNNESLNW